MLLLQFSQWTFCFMTAYVESVVLALGLNALSIIAKAAVHCSDRQLCFVILSVLFQSFNYSALDRHIGYPMLLFK